MSNVALNVPINSVSFGQVSTCILRELHSRGEMDPCIFPVGGSIDLSCQELSTADPFVDWLQKNANKSISQHSKSTPCFKLWHLNGSLESVSADQTLFTFYELDAPTPAEINIAKNQKKILLSSNYSVNVFKEFGVDTAHYVPLCFDKYNFKATGKKYFNDDRITFNLVGKFEKRKHHAKAISAWIKKYGNNKRYHLQCAIYNPFLKEEDNKNIFSQLMGGENRFNVSFLGFMPKNALYNDFLNSGDIVIGMSGGEGWGLPEFQSVGIGKHAVILNASAYKDWANEKNAVLVNPSGKIDAEDGVFFQKGAPFNQGRIFDFKEDDFIDACEEAIKRVESNRVNEEGLKIQEDFTVEKMVDDIFSHV